MKGNKHKLTPHEQGLIRKLKLRQMEEPTDDLGDIGNEENEEQVN
jgi:hypothetical protein